MAAVTDLDKRQAALPDEAGAVLAELDLPALGFGPALPTGSVVSGLMVWRDLDVMVLGEGLSPGDVLRLAARRRAVADRPARVAAPPGPERHRLARAAAVDDHAGAADGGAADQGRLAPAPGVPGRARGCRCLQRSAGRRRPRPGGVRDLADTSRVVRVGSMTDR